MVLFSLRNRIFFNRSIIFGIYFLMFACFVLGLDSYQYQQPSADHRSFAAEKDIKDQEHIKEHLRDEVDMDKMTDEQLHFHYFRMYDTNNDQSLDGVEIIHAMTHWDQHDDGAPEVNNTAMSEADLETTTDTILREADFDDNGLIAWGEFSLYLKKQDLELEKKRFEEEKLKNTNPNLTP